jgi:glycosyltransferase involved in cell wall biosynthesis
MKISVVLSVYNDDAHIAATLDSILAQTERDFELIIVDDGSTDTTAAILASYASRDERIRIVTQPNKGLTRALIRGCAEARADVIARNDSGDLSHPDRFRRQLGLLRGDVVLVACATEFAGPEGETLYVVKVDADEVRESLLHGDARHIHGIAGHGSAMFRRDAYLRAGGYREQFYFAQDLDLWARLAPLGHFAAVPEVLFTVLVEPRSLTTMNHDRQNKMKGIVVALRDGGDANALLAEAASIQPRKAKSRRAKAPGFYFIGRCLRKQRDPRARRYLLQAIAHDPFHFRAWVSLLTGR